MGVLLSQLEEQNEKFEKRLWTIERQVAFLNKMYAEIAPKGCVYIPFEPSEEQKILQLTFDEFAQEYSFLYRDCKKGIDYDVIPTYLVRKWLGL